MSYEDLLDDAYEEIKEVETNSRFEVPEIDSKYEGNKTIITNFKKITSYLNRDPKHLEKFLEGQLAAKGDIKGKRLFLYKKIPKRQIKNKLQAYIDSYVICKNCGKPDTEIKKEKKRQFIHCLACGDKQPIAKI